MEPFTSNDTYACPDCGSEVRVGARTCPGCGPFRAVEWEENEADAPNVPLFSMTTYNDTREVLEKSQQPILEIPEISEKPSRFARWFLVFLIALTVLAAGMAALKVLVLP